MTDSSGHFRFAKWRDVPSQIDVIVPRGGPLPSACVDNARPGTETVITVREADLPSAYLTGTLLGPDGKPSPEAYVTPTLPRGGARASPDAKTGAFRVGPLPAGDWRLVLGAPGGASQRLTVRGLAAHEVRELGTLTLPRPGTLEVTAKRRDGIPMRWTTWSFDDERGNYAGYVLVVDDGGECTTLAPGRYVAQVQGEGVAAARYPFTIVAGETTRLDVMLVPVTMTRLVLVPPQDDTSLALRLIVRAANAKPVFDQSITRAHRSVPFETALGLVAGKHRLEARTDAGAAAALESEIGTEARAPLRLELVR